ncbi:putative zf-mynd domain-containing protein [Botrytis fragariae]|uniref:Putative zf-mynd domain-containing protein n=1 Tax=Botrytis fragariae TaxID=1964551 RepID=A0A8H6AVY2_9HELO|nr:putative zf-mynd domain-containing protein [Botrytis fragariae]KAF5874763.1 putative zf-mynd domain-containing protein [Botrytis fragariae]
MSTVSNSQLLATTKRDFHEIVQQLFPKTQEPIEPQNYRSGTSRQSNSYTLLHEEEQHLADHIAVLAQAKEGATGVSAAMIEECDSRDSSSLTIRIASNETPLPKTVDELCRCLDIVEEAARAETDEHKDTHKSNLLMQIIKLSKSRLRRRIDLQKNRGGKVRPSLFDRVESLRCRLLVLETNVDKPSLRSSLCVNLSELCQKIESFTFSSEDRQTDQLTAVILAAHKVSTTANNPSLESQLQMKGIDFDLSHRRTVFQIDKISRYLDISNDLVDFSWKIRYNGSFRNIRLEVCTAPKAHYHNDQILHVHSKIQLISFYEQYPARLHPRCIGSSKSACFLCDLFIRKHKLYRISHSHGRLYPKWTVPEGDYVNEEMNLRFSEILKDMSQEMLQIKRTFVRRPGYEGNGAESRLHLLILLWNFNPISSRITEMRASLRSETSLKIAVVYKSQSELSEAPKATMKTTCQAYDLPPKTTTSSTVVAGVLNGLSTTLESGVIPGSNSAPSIYSNSPHPSPLYECHPQDLHITIVISPDNSLDTIVLSIGKVEYIFDICDMEFVYLNIKPTKQIDVLKGRERLQCKGLAKGNHEELRLIDVRGSELDGELVLAGKDSDSKEVEFSVNDGGECNICVKIIWAV